MSSRYRALFVSVLTLAMALAWSPPTPAFEDSAASDPDATVYSPVFADVPVGHLFEDPIRRVLASGITFGCDEHRTVYCPDDPVTRGQMAAFLTRALDLPAPAQRKDFTDDNGIVFEDAIERLAAAKITVGCNPPDNTRFCPNSPVTRGQIAAFLTRALPLANTPAVPAAVEFSRDTVSGDRRGTALSVCRHEEMSLLVRSVTADDGLGRWAPSSLDVSAGEFDRDVDRWFLPSGSGCDTLTGVWNPREVPLEDPLPVLRVASHFGPRRHPILGGVRNHTGTDFQAHRGDPVHASAPGVVIGAGTRGGYGRTVEIRHIGGLDTRYAHLSSISVSVGDEVGAGEIVGRVGCTGTCTGPHLHFETLHFGVAVDPMTHLR